MQVGGGHEGLAQDVRSNSAMFAAGKRQAICPQSLQLYPEDRQHWYTLCTTRGVASPRWAETHTEGGKEAGQNVQETGDCAQHSAGQSCLFQRESHTCVRVAKCAHTYVYTHSCRT